MAPRLSLAAMAIAAPLLVLGACQKSSSNGAAAPNGAANSVGPTAPPPLIGRAEFARMAAYGDLYEIDSGKLAEQRSRTPAVKAFAASMVRDHSAADAKLGKTLGTDGVGIGVTPAAGLDPEHQAMLDHLKAAPAADFDRMYLDQQVTAHEQAADLFNGYAQKGDAPALKAFAMQGLPMIDNHLARAKQLQLATARAAGSANPPPQ
jgi:putative membrane protein